MKVGDKLHSCYIVDVQFEKDAIILTDSISQRYFVPMTNSEAYESFTTWLKNDFIVGKPQKLVVFKYHIEGEGTPDMERRIDKIF